MKKIKIIGPAYPYRGGIAAFNEKLAIEYQARGASVSIETFRLQYPSFLFPGKSQYADWQPPDDLAIRRSINSVWPVSWIKTGRRILMEKNDLVIFKYWLPFMAPCLGSIARIIRKNPSTTVITVIDNIIPHEKRPGDRLLTEYFVKSQDGFIAMSGSVLDELRTFTTKKPGLLSPHPVYDNYGQKIKRKDALLNLKLDKSYRYILFFGLVRDYKGLDLLLDAMNDTWIRENRIKLLIAGEFYSDQSIYAEQIKKNGLEEYVIINNHFIPDDEVAYWFGACDLVVQPYKTATQSGITQIGYHFEKPMLVTNVGGLPEIITDGLSGYVVTPSAEAIRRAIKDFYINNRQEEMTRGVKEDKKRFTWEKMISSIDELQKLVKDIKK